MSAGRHRAPDGQPGRLPSGALLRIGSGPRHVNDQDSTDDTQEWAMGRGSKGSDGANAPDGPAPSTVDSRTLGKVIKGIGEMDPDERERLNAVMSESYEAFRRNRSD
jgi:hypothetical protein